MTKPPMSVGDFLREWRGRRRLSQLGLAAEAEISQRHLSFLESGRAAPSRDMVLRLARHLAVPSRATNALLLAAGFAPIYPERPLDDPALEAARRAVELILKGHEPHPALAVDRHWTLIAANRALQPLLAGIDGDLLAPPVNALRVSLHPRGLAPRIDNFREWRAHVLARLAREADLAADPVLIGLLEELRSYPYPANARPYRAESPAALRDSVAVPLRLVTEAGTLAFISTTTVFGTAIDVTIAEIAIESFFPADADTAEILWRAWRDIEGR